MLDQMSVVAGANSTVWKFFWIEERHKWQGCISMLTEEAVHFCAIICNNYLPSAPHLCKE